MLSQSARSNLQIRLMESADTARKLLETCKSKNEDENSLDSSISSLHGSPHSPLKESDESPSKLSIIVKEKLSFDECSEYGSLDNASAEYASVADESRSKSSDLSKGSLEEDSSNIDGDSSIEEKSVTLPSVKEEEKVNRNDSNSNDEAKHVEDQNIELTSPDRIERKSIIELLSSLSDQEEKTSQGSSSKSGKVSNGSVSKSSNESSKNSSSAAKSLSGSSKSSDINSFMVSNSGFRSAKPENNLSNISTSDNLIDSSSQNSDRDDQIEIIELQEKNKRLQDDNMTLQNEMTGFDQKLSSLEMTLGIIQNVEKSDQISLDVSALDSDDEDEDEYEDINGNDNTPNCKMEDTASLQLHQTEENSSISASVRSINSSRERKNAAVGRAGLGPLIDVSNQSVNMDEGRDEEPESTSVRSQRPPRPIKPTCSNRSVSSKKSSKSNKSNTSTSSSSKLMKNEIKRLQENSAKMLFAIKSLSRATMIQTRKHYSYKEKFSESRSELLESNKKMDLLSTGQEELKNKFHDVRAKLLMERDIREELSGEVQFLAKKLNGLRQEIKTEEENKSSILRVIESAEERKQVRFADPIIETALQNDLKVPSTPNILDDSMACLASPSHDADKKVMTPSPTGKMSLELKILDLQAKLEEKDIRIVILEKKTSIMKKYLKGDCQVSDSFCSTSIVDISTSLMSF